MTKTDLVKFRYWMRECLTEYLKKRDRNKLLDKGPIPERFPEFDCCNLTEINVKISDTSDFVRENGAFGALKIVL